MAAGVGGRQGCRHLPERFYPYRPTRSRIVEDPAAVTAGTVRDTDFRVGADCHARSAGDRIARVTAPETVKYPHDAVTERL